ncbi:MAG: response regulator [Bacteroidia bacterium]|nr:response regulator [Bacteroidia bacterium]
MISYNLVYLIDDNEIDNLINEKIIKKSGLTRRVVSFTQPQKALESLSKAEGKFFSVLPEIIFLDIEMPYMGGFQFLDDFARLPSNIQAHCRIVMLTSSINARDRHQARNYPSVRDYFTKPITQGCIRMLSSGKKWKINSRKLYLRQQDKLEDVAHIFWSDDHPEELVLCTENATLYDFVSNLDWFPDLVNLDLSDNYLPDMMGELARLPRLKNLDLSWNNLYDLSPDIGKFEQLENLDLSFNQLYELPYEIEKLQNLKSLDLQYNQLHELPQEVLKLRNLQEVALDGNPLIDPPIEVCEQGLGVIREYLSVRK